MSNKRHGIVTNWPKIGSSWGIEIERSATTEGALSANTSNASTVAVIGGNDEVYVDVLPSSSTRYWYRGRAVRKTDISDTSNIPGNFSKWVSSTPTPLEPLGGSRPQSLDGVAGGELRAGIIRDTSDTRGIRIDADNESPEARGWTHFLDLGSDGTSFLKHDHVDLRKDGTAIFSGDVQASNLTLEGTLVLSRNSQRLELTSNSIQMSIVGEEIAALTLDGFEVGETDPTVHIVTGIFRNAGSLHMTSAGSHVWLEALGGDGKVVFDGGTASNPQVVGVVVSSSTPTAANYPTNTLWLEPT